MPCSTPNFLWWRNNIKLHHYMYVIISVIQRSKVCSKVSALVQRMLSLNNQGIPSQKPEAHEEGVSASMKVFLLGTLRGNLKRDSSKLPFLSQTRETLTLWEFTNIYCVQNSILTENKPSWLKDQEGLFFSSRRVYILFSPPPLLLEFPEITFQGNSEVFFILPVMMKVELAPLHSFQVIKNWGMSRARLG